MKQGRFILQFFSAELNTHSGFCGCTGETEDSRAAHEPFSSTLFACKACEAEADRLLLKAPEGRLTGR
jgi:hypothetical protein